MRKILNIVLIASLIASTALAVEKISIRKFGGLNTKTNPLELQDSESPDCSNFNLDEAGTLTRRDLFQRYNTTSVGNIAFTNLYKFYTSADAGYMVLSGGTKLYKATGGTISDITTAGLTITPNSQWSFETFTDGANELCFAVNNDCVLQSWNGATATFAAEGGFPATNCNILKKHKSRLWAAGSRTFPYRIYYSSLSDADDWTTSGGTMDLPSYEKIMALEVLSDTLFIFTKTSIYALLGDTPNEFAIQKTRATVGTHACKSVVLGNKLIYFLNKAGVFVFDGDEIVNISETIQPTINDISNTYISKAASLFDNRGRLWLAHTSTNGTFNDKILIYDTVLKQWYPIDNLNFSALLKAEGGTDKGEVYATCSDSIGYLWKVLADSSTEAIVYSTVAQLDTCTTFNTAVSSLIGAGLQFGKDNYTKLLLHFNGIDGQTTYISEDFSTRTISFNGDAQLDTANKELGSASLLLDGSDSVTVPNSTDFNFGTGDYTIEMWAKFNTVGNNRTFIDNGNIAANKGIVLIYSANTLYVQLNGGATFGSFGWTPDTDWHHIAVARESGTTRAFIDGGQIGADWADATNIDNAAFNTTIGSQTAGILYFDGWIDEVRISKGIARYTSNFNVYGDEFDLYSYGGMIASKAIQINASGSASLGSIKWQENLPTNTDIQFTTRTGVTADDVYYNGWQTWVSSNVVTVNTVTDANVWMPLTGVAVYWSASNPFTPQRRDITNYETYDSVSPNCVQFDAVGGILATNKFCDITVPEVNLTNDKFIGYWLKSHTTGNSVQLAIGETTGNITAYITANTVMPNTWEFHYWPLANYTQTDIDSIKFMRVTYLGNATGTTYLGDVSAYDFLDNDKTITSTPNDFIQFMGILGSTQIYNVPHLINAAGYVISLSYSSPSGISETSLNSYWKSKFFDGGTQVNKSWQWMDLTLESQNPTTGHSVYLNWWTDDGRQSGTVSGNVVVTNRTVNLKLYFPTGTYGKNFAFEIEDNELNDKLRVRQVNIYCIPEGNY